MNPFIINIGGLHIGGRGSVTTTFDAQHFGPEIGPQISEAVALQQAVNQDRTLVIRGVRHELLIVLGRGQCAAEVQEHAAQEGLVITHRRRQQPQLLQAVMDDFVDVVVRDRVRPPVVFVLRQHDDLGADGEAVEACKDMRVATAGGGDDAVFIDLGGGGIV